MGGTYRAAVVVHVILNLRFVNDHADLTEPLVWRSLVEQDQVTFGYSFSKGMFAAGRPNILRWGDDYPNIKSTAEVPA